jgi:signal transduction histidine kinase
VGFGRLPQAPRRVLTLFLAVTILPAAALGWLSWKLIQQDRELEAQRMRDTLGREADRIVTALEQRLDEAGSLLSDPPAARTLPEGALIVEFDARGIRAHPSNRLIYYPSSALATEAEDDVVFARGEALEFNYADHAGAISEFRALTHEPRPAIRAGALIRLARNLRKSGRAHEALAIYDQLKQLDGVSIGGTDAALLAREASCTVLAELGRDAELKREAMEIRDALDAGRWQFDRVGYLFHRNELQRWIPAGLQPKPPSEEALALAESVEWLWNEWRQAPRGQRNLSGQRSLWQRGKPVMALWNGSPETVNAFFAGSTYMASQLSHVWTGSGIEVALTDSDGHQALGVVRAGTAAIRTPTETRLPWTVRVSNSNPQAQYADLALRRRLLFAGLSIMAALTLIGGYWTARAAAREFAVSRLQSDFVSAVSHEFRSPLTSLRHLTELLDSGTVTNEDRRRQYYAVLSREIERLQRLVEGLLDFGRMEAGSWRNSLDHVDPVELIENIVADFQSDMRPPTHRIEIRTNDLPLRTFVVSVNREAFGRAVRNLLENAVKYSPGQAAVQVAVQREGGRLAIRIHDDGFGILVDEQKTIFEKFVRGAAAKSLQVQGTGIGLAMAQHIVLAHHGEILLESEPGRGSTFTIEIPIVVT